MVEKYADGALQQVVHTDVAHTFEQVRLEGGISLGEALDFFADALAVTCLRKFAGAGELADVGVFGVLDDFGFFAVAQRPDDAARVFLVGDHRRHAAEFALVQHVHQERLYDVIHVVAECNLVVSVFAGELDELGAALRAAPVAVELAAFLETSFDGNVLEEEWNLRILFGHALQEFARSLVGKVALDMDRSDFAVRQEFSHTARELHQQHAGILASAYGDQYLVAVFNQVEVVESLGDFSTDAFADGVGHWE